MHTVDIGPESDICWICRSISVLQRGAHDVHQQDVGRRALGNRFVGCKEPSRSATQLGSVNCDIDLLGGVPRDRLDRR
jgi:hypothetical protein